jgi:predicted HicB family RNase H-like nuclease
MSESTKRHPGGRPKGHEPPRAVVSAKLPVADHAELCRAAAQQRVTVSEFVTRSIRRALSSGKP